MRSPALPLAWHLTRSAGRRGLQSHLPAAGAGAVGAFVMPVIIAGTLGAGTRADHTTWRIPDAVPAQLDTAVTALTPLGDGRLPYGRDYAGGSDKAVFDRLSAVSTGTLVLSFLVAASSAGLTAAANVLNRRRVYGLLRLAGTPLRALDRARVRETVIPLVVLAGGTTAMGAYGSYQLNKAAGATINTSGALELLACVVVGALAVLAAISGSRPLLRKVTTDPAQTAD